MVCDEGDVKDVSDNDYKILDVSGRCDLRWSTSFNTLSELRLHDVNSVSKVKLPSLIRYHGSLKHLKNITCPRLEIIRASHGYYRDGRAMNAVKDLFLEPCSRVDLQLFPNLVHFTTWNALDVREAEALHSLESLTADLGGVTYPYPCLYLKNQSLRLLDIKHAVISSLILPQLVRLTTRDVTIVSPSYSLDNLEIMNLNESCLNCKIDLPNLRELYIKDSAIINMTLHREYRREQPLRIHAMQNSHRLRIRHSSEIEIASSLAQIYKDSR